MRRTDISPLALLIHRVDAVADGAPLLDTVATAFPSVDRMLGGGVRRGDLVVLGGDVGCGKSALALAFALRMAADGARVAFYSGEMTVDRLLERSLAIEGRVKVDDVRRGGLGDAGRASIGAAAVRLRDNTPHLAVLPPGGVTALAQSIRGEPERPSVILIDALPALAHASPHGDSGVGGDAGNASDVGDAVRQLKALALELDVAVVAVAPLTRLDRRRQDLRPCLDDFGASGRIKEHADVVLAIFREDMYDTGLGVEGATELLVLKNRNGATGYVDLYFYRKWMRFEDMLEPDR